MMAAGLRTLGGIAAGLVVTFILIVAVEFLSAVLHPFPEEFKGTHEEVCRHVERFPQWVLAVAVAAWGVTAFAGTWTAGRVGSRGCALFLGLLLLAALIFNISMLPYSHWFKMASLIVIPMAIACGYRMSSRRARAAANITE
jgi:hypothetical protein